jgi:hypothetical protein
MKEVQEYEKDIASIRNMMERSVKFISLSGLSGVIAGIYALAGAAYVYYLIYYPYSPFGFRFYYANQSEVIIHLLTVAIIVLSLSIGTGFWFSQRKAKKLGVTIWNNASKQLMIDLIIPLVTGGLFILILLSRNYYGVAAPACLIFYGLALINASRNTYSEVRYLGFTEITLGLISALIPGYGLIFWAMGFGVMHILYGAVMYFRHDT